jgi:hypothetical protein
MTIQVKEMKAAQMYRADSAPQAPNSALRGRMQRLGLTLLAFALVIGVTDTASASQTQHEAAIRALGDNFAKAFVRVTSASDLGRLSTHVHQFVLNPGKWYQWYHDDQSYRIRSPSRGGSLPARLKIFRAFFMFARAPRSRKNSSVRRTEIFSATARLIS